MKKYYLLMLFCALSFSLLAQIEEKTVYMGVNSHINYSTTSFGTSTNLNQFSLDLKAGYFFINNLMAGFGIGYNSVSFENFINGDAVNWQLFSRYYRNNAFLGLAYTSYKEEGYDPENAFQISGGYAAFITDNITIEPLISYGLGLGENDANTLSINLGFGIYINRYAMGIE